MNNRIKELRKKNNLTLNETGKREPKLETWKKLADFFDVPIAYLQGTTSYIKKYELWVCSRCEKHFLLRKNQSIVHIAEAQNDYAMGLLRQLVFKSVKDEKQD